MKHGLIGEIVDAGRNGAGEPMVRIKQANGNVVVVIGVPMIWLDGGPRIGKTVILEMHDREQIPTSGPSRL